MTARTIIVTGTSRGIGAGVAVELARRGFQVACLSRTGGLPQTDEPLEEEIAKRLLPFTCDVADEAAVIATFKSVAEQTGGIWGLVNNAGVHREDRASAIKTKDFEDVMRVNTTAVMVACREVYPYLLAGGRGVIVNIGSFFDKLGMKGSIAYAASKAAVGALTRCLAAEWGGKGISVLNIAPGYIETDINRDFLADPVTGASVRARTFTARAGQVSEVARLIGAIFAEDIPFLTGETIYIDGGQGIRL